jgi:hypothetical protein
MKRYLCAIAATAAMFTAPAFAQVGVSISVGQPGFYGQIDIGDYPRPSLVYARPVVIAPPPVHVVREPIYLHVPPGQAKNWRRYCGRYDACGRPVYFVQDTWYNNVYVPRYRERYESRRDDRRDDYRDDRRDDDHDRGNNGNGKGKGKH